MKIVGGLRLGFVVSALGSSTGLLVEPVQQPSSANDRLTVDRLLSSGFQEPQTLTKVFRQSDLDQMSAKITSTQPTLTSLLSTAASSVAKPENEIDLKELLDNAWDTCHKEDAVTSEVDKTKLDAASECLKNTFGKSCTETNLQLRSDLLITNDSSGANFKDNCVNKVMDAALGFYKSKTSYLAYEKALNSSPSKTELDSSSNPSNSSPSSTSTSASSTSTSTSSTTQKQMDEIQKEQKELEARLQGNGIDLKSQEDLKKEVADLSDRALNDLKTGSTQLVETHTSTKPLENAALPAETHAVSSGMTFADLAKQARTKSGTPVRPIDQMQPSPDTPPPAAAVAEPSKLIQNSPGRASATEHVAKNSASMTGDVTKDATKQEHASPDVFAGSKSTGADDAVTDATKPSKLFIDSNSWTSASNMFKTPSEIAEENKAKLTQKPIIDFSASPMKTLCCQIGQACASGYPICKPGPACCIKEPCHTGLPMCEKPRMPSLSNTGGPCCQWEPCPLGSKRCLPVPVEEYNAKLSMQQSFGKPPQLAIVGGFPNNALTQPVGEPVGSPGVMQEQSSVLHATKMALSKASPSAPQSKINGATGQFAGEVQYSNVEQSDVPFARKAELVAPQYENRDPQNIAMVERKASPMNGGNYAGGFGSGMGVGRGSGFLNGNSGLGAMARAADNYGLSPGFSLGGMEYTSRNAAFQTEGGGGNHPILDPATGRITGTGASYIGGAPENIGAITAALTPGTHTPSNGYDRSKDMVQDGMYYRTSNEDVTTMPGDPSGMPGTLTGLAAIAADANHMNAAIASPLPVVQRAVTIQNEQGMSNPYNMTVIQPMRHVDASTMIANLEMKSKATSDSSADFQAHSSEPALPHEQQRQPDAISNAQLKEDIDALDLAMQ